MAWGAHKMVYEVPDFDIVFKVGKPQMEQQHCEDWRTECQLSRAQGFRDTWIPRYFGEFEVAARKSQMCQRVCQTGEKHFSTLIHSGQWRKAVMFLQSCLEILCEALGQRFQPCDMKLDNWGMMGSGHRL